MYPRSGYFLVSMYLNKMNTIHPPILDLSVKFASQICCENTNTPLDGADLANFGIDIGAITKFIFLISQFLRIEFP